MRERANEAARRLAAEVEQCQCPDFAAFHGRDPLQLRGNGAAFKPFKELGPQWLPSECVDDSGDSYLNVYKGTEGGVAVVLWVLWVIASLLLLWLFARKRKFQPLKFRTLSMTSVLWLNLNCMMTLNLANIAMDMSGSTVMELVAICICLFIHMFVYIMKALQLAHMYRWSEMKVTEQPSGLFGPSVLQVKQTRKDLMNYGASWKGMLTVAILGIIMVVVSRYNVNTLTQGDSLYSSTRCQWYTDTSSETTDSCPFTSCTQLLVFENDSPSMVQACSDELNTVCGGSSLEYAAICDKCSTSFSCGCQEKFQDMYMNGDCGSFEEMPYFASCRHGYGASPILSGVVAAILIVLILATIYSYLLIMHINDKLCLHNECLFAGIVNVLCATLIVLYILYDDFYIETWEGLGFPLPWLLMVLMSFWCLAVSIAYPVIVCYFVRLRHERNQASKANVLAESGKASKKRSPRSSTRARKARHDIDALFDPTDPDEMQLRFCLHDKPALRIYLTFAVKELSVENIKFVDKVFDLRRQADVIDLAEVGAKALQIYNEHIRAGSNMEVNLPARVAKQIHKIFEPIKVRRRSLSGSARQRTSLSGLSAALSLGIANWHSHSADRQDAKHISASNSGEVTLVTVPSMTPSQASQASLAPSRSASPTAQTEAGDDRTEVPQWPSSAMADDRGSIGGGMRRSTAQSTVFDVERGSASPRITPDGGADVYCPIPTVPNDVLKWFLPAVEEIKRLIIRDSWPRFQQTYRFKEFAHRLEHEDGVESSIRFLLSEDSDDEEQFDERKTESQTGRRSSEGMRSVPSMNQLFNRRSSAQTVSTVEGLDGPASNFFRLSSATRRHSADTDGIHNPLRRIFLQGGAGPRRSSESLSYLGRLQQQLSFNRRPASLKIPPHDTPEFKPRPATAGPAISPREHQHQAQSPASPRSPLSPRRASADAVNFVPFAQRERRASDSITLASPRSFTPKSSNTSTPTHAARAGFAGADDLRIEANTAERTSEDHMTAEMALVRDSEDQLMPLPQLTHPGNWSPQPPTDEPPSTISNGSHGELSSLASSNGSPRVILEQRSKSFDLGPLSNEPFQPPRLGRRSPQPSGTFSWRDISTGVASPKSNVVVLDAEHKSNQPLAGQSRSQPSSAKSLTLTSSAEWSGNNHPMTAPAAQHRRARDQELVASRNRRSLRRASKERSSKTGEWATRDIPINFRPTRTRTRSAMSIEDMNLAAERRHPRTVSRSDDWTSYDPIDQRRRLFSGGHETKSDSSSRDDAHFTSPRFLNVDNRVTLPVVQDLPADIESQPLSEATHTSAYATSPRSGVAGSESNSGDAGSPEVTRKHVRDRQSNSAARLFGVLP